MTYKIAHSIVFVMDNEFNVIAVDVKLNLAGRFQQTPRYDAQLGTEIIDKMGFVDGDLIEIKGKKTTAARVVTTDKDDFNGDNIGLTDLIRTNAQVSSGNNVTIRKVEPTLAQHIVLAPIGKHLKKSELLKIVAKKSFTDTPFVEGDVTYLRSKVLKYLLGSMTWLRVIKTEPDGIVVANYDTDFEILPDPISQTLDESTLHYLQESHLTDNVWENNLLLNDIEWTKINSLIELGVFSTLPEAITFLLREGINVRNDLFKETVSVMDQIKQIKENFKNVP
jgi:hypothetical protein